MPDGHEYACENDDLFAKVLDVDWFLPFINYQFASVSFANCSLRPVLSRYNLLEALSSYRSDIKDLERRENGGGEAEQFKKAAFLAYWLRRVSPIQSIIGTAPAAKASTATDFQSFLIAYANEYCAFDLGFRISRYWVTRDEDLEHHSVRITSVYDGITNEIDFKNISHFRLSRAYIRDVCQLMKEKNVSPHALYLMYKGIFELFR